MEVALAPAVQARAEGAPGGERRWGGLARLQAARGRVGPPEPHADKSCRDGGRRRRGGRRWRARAPWALAAAARWRAATTVAAGGEGGWNTPTRGESATQRGEAPELHGPRSARGEGVTADTRLCRRPFVRGAPAPCRPGVAGHVEEEERHLLHGTMVFTTTRTEYVRAKHGLLPCDRRGSSNSRRGDLDAVRRPAGLDAHFPDFNRPSRRIQESTSQVLPRRSSTLFNNETKRV